MKILSFLALVVQLCYMPVIVNAGIYCVGFPEVIKPGSTIKAVLPQHYEPHLGAYDVAIAFGYSAPKSRFHEPLTNFIHSVWFGPRHFGGSDGNVTVDLILPEDMPPADNYTLHAALFTIQGFNRKPLVQEYSVPVLSGPVTSSKLVYSNRCMPS